MGCSAFLCGSCPPHCPVECQETGDLDYSTSDYHNNEEHAFHRGSGLSRFGRRCDGLSSSYPQFLYRDNAFLAVVRIAYIQRPLSRWCAHKDVLLQTRSVFRLIPSSVLER